MPHKVIDLFDRLAPEWDQVLPFFAAMAEQAVSALPVREGMRVLDLGAGAGAVTARLLAAGARVTAVDAAPAMVARLRRDCPAADAAVMDACELRFPDRAFDLVVAALVMHILDDPAAAAAEVRRVLVPGGMFAFTVPGPAPGAGPSGRQLTSDLWGEFSQYLPPGGGSGSPLDEGALLRDAGFTDIAASLVTIDLPMPGGGEMLWQWHLTHGTAAFIGNLPPDRRAEFRRRLVAETDASGTRNLRLTASLWTGTLQNDSPDAAP